MLGDERLLRCMSDTPCRILIVDDDSSLREALLRLLPRRDIEIVDPVILGDVPGISGIGIGAAAYSLAAHNLALHARECAHAFDSIVLPSFERIAAELQIPQPIEWVQGRTMKAPWLLASPRTKRLHYRRARKRARRSFMQLVRKWSRY